MKNKKILKKWIQVVIGFVMIMAMMIGASDCELTTVFVVKEIVCAAVMLICFVLLKKYTNLFDESEGK